MAHTLTPIALGTRVLTATGQVGTLEAFEHCTSIGTKYVVRLNTVLSFVVSPAEVAPLAEVVIVPVTTKTPGVEVRKYAESPISWQRSQWLVRVGVFSTFCKTRTAALETAAPMLAVAQWHAEAAS